MDIEKAHNIEVQLEEAKSIRKEPDLITEIVDGLFSNKPFISSKFFYDNKGSALFEAITQLPEYYLSRTEKEILRSLKETLASMLPGKDLIELGSGDCSKVSLMLDAVANDDISTIRYLPLDISRAALEKSKYSLSHFFPDLEIIPIVADFMNSTLEITQRGKRLFCFLGSTLGNLDRNEGIDLLKNLAIQMRPEDQLLLGLDRVKSVDILEDAYNDSQAVTAEFNLNILNVVNNKIESDFNIRDFEHYAFYNENEARIEMHLIARRNLTVSSPYFPKYLHLKKGDSIHTENSHKFSDTHIRQLSLKSGLKIKKMYSDSEDRFSLLLMENI